MAPWLEDLARSGILEDAARRAGIYPTKNARDVDPTLAPAPGYVFPYLDQSGAPLTYLRSDEPQPFLRVRYLEPPTRQGGFTRKTKAQRYGQPARSGCRAYFPRTDVFDWLEVSADKGQYLVVTEGEKKALKACLEGVPTIGLGGVFNFLASGDLLPELGAIPWAGRQVFVIFDSDGLDNPNVRSAEGRLSYLLGAEHGADVRIVRLPETVEGVKVGLDDYLLEHGCEALLALMANTPPARPIDKLIAKLNRDIAWIEEDGAVLDTNTNVWIKKDNLKSGSSYSSLKMLRPAKRGDHMVEESVAENWLTHPHARRYDCTMFQPDSEEEVFARSGRVVYNLWRGWTVEPVPGDITPWLELEEYLFQRAAPEVREAALNLAAYKFQNPGKKIPLCVLLIGGQGSGKSSYAQGLQLAAGEYGKAITAETIVSAFNEWLERALIVAIDEFDHIKNFKGADQMFKTLVSDREYTLNGKYRTMKRGQNYASFWLTANRYEAAEFDHDDRRVIVIDCPDPLTEQVPDGLWQRLNALFEHPEGPGRILHYHLTRDLQGWQPPERAPLSAGKYMALQENLGPLGKIALAMRDGTQHIILQWCVQAERWADSNIAADNATLARIAGEVRAALSAVRVGPWYTADELRLLLAPVIHDWMGGRITCDAGSLSRELRNRGIRQLENLDDPRGFLYRGRYQNFLVVANFETHSGPITQAQFDKEINNFPTYSDLRNQIRDARLRARSET